MACEYSNFHVGETQVSLRKIARSKSVCMGIWFRAGGRYETERPHGVAHFIEHMLFKGTKRRNALLINQEIESRGGDLNAFTSEELSCYYVRIAAEHFRVALDVLLDMVLHSNFPKAEVERERGVIQEEIRMYEDQPSSVATDCLNALLWPGDMLGRVLTGTVESVGNMSRTELVSFWKSHYHPANMLVTVAGAVDKRELENELSKRLMSLSVEPEVPLPARARELSGITAKQVYLKRNFQQINVAAGGIAYSRHDKRRFALRVMSVLLGENSCSRIFQTLRERHGLVYSVSTSIAQFQDTGAFYIQGGLDAENYPAFVKLVRKELEKICRKSVSPQELKMAKDFAIGQMILNMENPMHQVMWMGEGIAGYGTVPSHEAWCRDISRVTSREVQDVAREVFQPGRMAVVCVGKGIDDRAFQKDRIV